MNRALLVGLDEYDDSRKNLRGCVNDVLHASRTLVKSYNYREVVALYNQKATKENILNEFEQLVSVTKPGDNAVFHYSGHGCQVPDIHGEESDSFDECLVSYDHSWSNPLSDDDIRFCLRNHAEGANIYMIIDACHAGGMYDTASTKADFHPPEIMEAILNKTSSTATNKFGKKNSDPKTQRHFLYSACSSDGKALERKVGGDWYRGLFSHMLFNVSSNRWIRKSNWKRLTKIVNRKVRYHSKLKQNPVVVCNDDALSQRPFGL